MPKVQRSIVCHIDKDIEIREETFLGRTFTVVPVVAMVEGVRFGANQSVPELGLASEFGDNPILWANRPLVLNHPMVDGSYVSANSPDVLTDYYFGLTMNPVLDGDKLKLEAWFDIEHIKDQGGEFEELYDKIIDEDNEDLIEVSVGFFSDLEQSKGKFKNQSYGGIWRNIRPDHLAILSEGILGACSVKDGCGIPRINQKGGDMAKATLKTDSSGTPKGQCSCGGQHAQHEHVDDNDADVNNGDIDTLEVNNLGVETPKKGSVPSVKPQEKPFEEVAAELRANIRQVNHALITQSIDGEMLDTDIRKVLTRALNKKFGSYTYLYAFNANEAFYESYNYDSGGYKINKIGVNISNDAVEFVGEPSEVILLTKVVPQKNDKTPIAQTEENDMAGDKSNDKTKVQEETETTVTEPTAQSSKKLTAQEYVDQAPDEIREMLQAGLTAQSERRESAIKTLKDHKSNKFSDDDLKAMSLSTLEKMVSLIPANYSGVAPANMGMPRFQESNSEGAPEAPKVFAKKEATAA